MAMATIERKPDGSPRRKAPFDGWGQHPAPFEFATLTRALRAVSAEPGITVCDPFAGSARSGTRAAGRGLRFVGIEAHPLLAELGAVKFARPASEEDFDEAAQALLDSVQPIPDVDAEHPAVRRFVDPRALTTLCALRNAVVEEASPWEVHLRWSILAALRQQTGPGWPYRRERRERDGAVDASGDVRRAVLRHAATMAADLATGPLLPPAVVNCGDARTAAAWETVAPASLDAVVTSPPYLNQLSYLEAMRLESLFLDSSQSAAEMRARNGRGLLTSCTQQTTISKAEAAWQELAERSPAVLELLRPLAAELAGLRLERAQGKPYDRLLPCFFAEMRTVLEYQIRALAPGATAAWVVGDSAPYGIRVDTPALIGRLAVSLGYELGADTHLRGRGQRWSTSRRPVRDLTERMIVMRRPASGAIQLPLPGF